MSLAKNLIDVLVSFVAVNFASEKLQAQKDKALNSLKALFEKFEFVLVADGTTSKTKGAKSTAHNVDEAKYLRVTKKGMDCAILVKPVYASQPVRFLGWVVVPDSNRIVKQADLEDFLLCFQASSVKKHDEAEQAILSASARQIGEDIRNNSAQKWLRKEAQADNLKKIASPFLNLPNEQWALVRSSVALGMGEETAEFIDDMRSEALEASVS
jgi:hypothetical protein